MTDAWLIEKITACIQQIEKIVSASVTGFPPPSGTNGKYRIKANDDWTNGFWTGMLWLAYEWTKQEEFFDACYGKYCQFSRAPR